MLVIMGCCVHRAEPTTEWYPDFESNLPSMAGKRVAITGTTSGTGFVAAAACARKGAEVILLNRPSDRATDAEARLRAEVPTGVFSAIDCDLQSFASVRTVKAKFDSKYGEGASLDVLACNAGIANFPDQVTTDGFDVQMQTNHLSHFLLVKELLPSLRAAAKEKGEARVISHSSDARNQGEPFEAKFLQKHAAGALGGDGVTACFERYNQSKLAVALFTFALEAKLEAAGLGSVKPVACTPGLAATSIWDNRGIGHGCLIDCLQNAMSAAYMQSAEDATMPLLECIAGTDVQSGDLITPSKGAGGLDAYGPPKVYRRPFPESEKSVDKAAQDMMWVESEKAIEERFDVLA